jgi:hypothetical protein
MPTPKITTWRQRVRSLQRAALAELRGAGLNLREIAHRAGISYDVLRQVSADTDYTLLPVDHDALLAVALEHACIDASVTMLPPSYIPVQLPVMELNESLADEAQDILGGAGRGTDVDLRRADEALGAIPSLLRARRGIDRAIAECLAAAGRIDRTALRRQHHHAGDGAALAASL